MKKHLIQYNLLKNSIAAYFAMIEIHNKPRMMYRYETVTLLMINSWELCLKSFIRKYIKRRSIFKPNGRTIELNVALSYVKEFINSNENEKFNAVEKNILAIEEYRNNITHFYNEELEPYIFMLIAKSALNYANFIKKYFHKDIMTEECLYILPIGFKLPFKPENFLSNKAATKLETKEAKDFMNKIISTITDLKERGVEESIVVGFNIYMESIKKCSNSDIIAAITTMNDEDLKVVQEKKVKISNDPNAPKVNISEEGIIENYPLSYEDVWKKCKEEILNFKKDKQFNKILNELKKDIKYSFGRKIYLKSKNNDTTYLYSKSIVEEIKKRYK